MKHSMYAMDVVAFGTMHVCCVSTGLPCWCKDKESSAVCRHMPSVHLATGSMEFRPTMQFKTFFK